jgi:hypothetical protein
MGERDDDGVRKGVVRQRVKKHLHKLLVPGLIGLGACKGSSSGGDVVCDPLPDPSYSPEAGPPPDDPGRVLVPVEGDADVPPDKGNEPDAGPPPVVCDPLPMPPPRKK